MHTYLFSSIITGGLASLVSVDVHTVPQLLITAQAIHLANSTPRQHKEKGNNAQMIHHKSDLFNLHRLPAVASLALHPHDKVIQRTRPGAVGAPPSKVLVLVGLAHEDLDLLPEVLVDRLLAPPLEELDPPVQPGSRLRVPLDPSVLGREEETPLLRGDVELQVALALETAERESVAVDSAEEVGLGGDASAKRGHVLYHLGNRVASFSMSEIILHFTMTGKERFIILTRQSSNPQQNLLG